MAKEYDYENPSPDARTLNDLNEWEQMDVYKNILKLKESGYKAGDIYTHPDINLKRKSYYALEGKGKEITDKLQKLELAGAIIGDAKKDSVEAFVSSDVYDDIWQTLKRANASTIHLGGSLVRNREVSYKLAFYLSTLGLTRLIKDVEDSKATTAQVINAIKVAQDNIEKATNLEEGLFTVRAKTFLTAFAEIFKKFVETKRINFIEGAEEQFWKEVDHMTKAMFPDNEK